ncbi:hypothetical protein SDC9_96128 [bioreactor metagenome]|uniref:Uncharacterized protein n=1 Tax=bioreactor metagenome TaxID=1076179 RepID=A0A645A894_9ZZZZ
MIQKHSLVSDGESVISDAAHTSCQIGCDFMMMIDMGHEIHIFLNSLVVAICCCVDEFQQIVRHRHGHHNRNPCGNSDYPQMADPAQLFKDVLQPLTADHQSISAGHQHFVDVAVLRNIEKSLVNFRFVDFGCAIKRLCPLAMNAIRCTTGVLRHKKCQPVRVALISCSETARSFAHGTFGSGIREKEISRSRDALPENRIKAFFFFFARQQFWMKRILIHQRSVIRRYSHGFFSLHSHDFQCPFNFRSLKITERDNFLQLFNRADDIFLLPGGIVPLFRSDILPKFNIVVMSWFVQEIR